MTTYTRSLATDFPSGLVPRDLFNNILVGIVSPVLNYINVSGDVVSLTFASALPDEVQLNLIISQYVYVVESIAGGSNTQVQYNTSGSFAGATGMTITSDGLPVIGPIDGSITVASPTTGAKIYSSFSAGRNMLSQVEPFGMNYEFQPSIFSNNIMWSTAQGNTTTVATINFVNTATGTATARVVATTNLFTSMRRIGYVSANGAGSSAGVRHATQQFWRGNAAGLGGFYYMTRFGLSSASSVTTQRSFVGLVASTAALANANPSALTNMLGFGVDTADSTWTFMHNDAAGTATKDPLTGTFPPRDLSVSMFEARIFCPPNSSTIYYSLRVLGGGSYYSGSTSTDLPSNTTLLSPYIWTNNGATSTAVGIDVVVQYIETEY